LGQTIEIKLTREKIFAVLDKIKPKYREVIVLGILKKKVMMKFRYYQKTNRTVGTMINRPKNS
jgi:hypothetical protein